MITPKKTLLLIIDVQERLARSVVHTVALEINIKKLIRSFRALDVPVLVTEQYPKGLGPTLSSLGELLPGTIPVEKIAFSCCGTSHFMESLRLCNRNDILIVGMEAHICVYQTAVGLFQKRCRYLFTIPHRWL
ncbi:MAG: isochorismatase family protein [Chlorobiaceae bacterium]|nr:isochorismatase family protein [Chlorobiaceae bacterium]